MSKTKNLYLDAAHLYDAYVRELYDDADIPFYLSYANASQRILELACGTGRVAIPLAKDGCTVTGLDLSRPMLQVFQTKLKFALPEVRDRIDYTESDMTDFDLNQKYDLVIVPLRSFMALTTDAERRSCLSCIRNHMKKDSLAILTMFDPKPDHLRLGSSIDLEFYDKDLKCTVRRHTFIDGHARAKQIIHSHFKFELLQDDKVIDTRSEYLELGYLYSNQAQDLFKECDFRIIESYGWYDKSPIDENNKSELIYVLQKK